MKISHKIAAGLDRVAPSRMYTGEVHEIPRVNMDVVTTETKAIAHKRSTPLEDKVSTDFQAEGLVTQTPIATGNKIMKFHAPRQPT